jgi:hypothetical protein
MTVTTPPDTSFTLLDDRTIIPLLSELVPPRTRMTEGNTVSGSLLLNCTPVIVVPAETEKAFANMFTPSLGFKPTVVAPASDATHAKMAAHTRPHSPWFRFMSPSTLRAA